MLMDMKSRTDHNANKIIVTALDCISSLPIVQKSQAPSSSSGSPSLATSARSHIKYDLCRLSAEMATKDELRRSELHRDIRASSWFASLVNHWWLDASCALSLNAGSTVNNPRINDCAMRGASLQCDPRKRESPVSTGSRCKERRIVTSEVSKGGLPQKNWYNTTPTLQRSHLGQ